MLRNDNPPMQSEETGACHNPLLLTAVENDCEAMGDDEQNSPRRTQLEPGFIERETLRLKRLHRAAVIEVIPWNGSIEPEARTGRH